LIGFFASPHNGNRASALRRAGAAHARQTALSARRGQAGIVPFLIRHGVADKELEADDAVAIPGRFASEFQAAPSEATELPRSLSTAPIP